MDKQNGNYYNGLYRVQGLQKEMGKQMETTTMGSIGFRV